MTPQLKQFLAESGFKNISDKLQGGLSPLHVAVKAGRADLIEELKKELNDIDPVDELNQTPIFSAISSQRAEIVSILLRLNANVFHFDNKGKTPLMLSFEVEDVRIRNQMMYKLNNIVVIFKLPESAIISEAENQIIDRYAMAVERLVKNSTEESITEFNERKKAAKEIIKRVTDLSQNYSNTATKAEDLMKLGLKKLKKQFGSDNVKLSSFVNEFSPKNFLFAADIIVNELLKILHTLMSPFLNEPEKTVKLAGKDVNDSLIHILPYIIYMHQQHHYSIKCDYLGTSKKYLNEKGESIYICFKEPIKSSNKQLQTYFDELYQILKSFLEEFPQEFAKHFRLLQESKGKHNKILACDLTLQFLKSCFKDCEKKFQEMISESLEKSEKIASEEDKKFVQEIIKDANYIIKNLSESMAHFQTLIERDQISAIALIYNFKRNAFKQFESNQKFLGALLNVYLEKNISLSSEARSKIQEIFLNSFEVINLQDKRKRKEIEDQRREMTAQFKAKTLQRIQEEKKQKERQKMETQHSEALANNLMTSINDLPSKTLLNLILTYGHHLHQKVDTNKFCELVKKLPPFELKETSDGFSLSFDQQILTTFHREHDKKLDGNVLKAFKEIFDQLEISFESLKTIKNPVSNRSF